MWEGWSLTGFFACHLMQRCNGKTPWAASSPSLPSLDNRAPLPSSPRSWRQPVNRGCDRNKSLANWWGDLRLNDVFCSDTPKHAQTISDTTALYNLSEFSFRIATKGKNYSLVKFHSLFSLQGENNVLLFINENNVWLKNSNVFLSIFVLLFFPNVS